MLQLAQRTLAPRSPSVSIKTAVCTVICNDPVTRTPASGLLGAYFSRIAIRPGISFSAMLISLRPHSARDMSRTLKSVFFVVSVDEDMGIETNVVGRNTSQKHQATHPYILM